MYSLSFGSLARAENSALYLPDRSGLREPPGDLLLHSVFPLDAADDGGAALFGVAAVLGI